MSNNRKKKKIIYGIALVFSLLLGSMAQVYASEQQNIEISIEVELDGQSESDAETEIFQIQISPEDEGNPMPENDVIQIEGAGTASFVISYDQEGTYVYTIRQIRGESSNIEYSSETYQVKLEVIEDNGLKGYLSIRSDASGDKVDKIIFSNSVKESDNEDTDKDKDDTDKDDTDKTKQNTDNTKKSTGSSTRKATAASGTGKRTSASSRTASSVKTEDSSNLYIWMTVFTLSLSGLALSTFVRRNRNKR